MNVQNSGTDPFILQGLKAGFCPALASSDPICPGIVLLLAHCLAARPLPPAYGLGDKAKPPENRQNLPVAALHQLRHDRAAMSESEKQFSFTRATPSTGGRAKNQIQYLSWPRRSKARSKAQPQVAKTTHILSEN